jgi:hypothetical protein
MKLKANQSVSLSIAKIQFLTFTTDFFIANLLKKYVFEASLFKKIIVCKYILFDRVSSFFLDFFCIKKDLFKTSTNSFSY